MSPSKQKAPAICPVCGEAVPSKCVACPECGADHNSGWKEGAELYDGLDLPSEEFNYEEFSEREFGSRLSPAGVKRIWWITAAVLIAALICLYLR